LNQKISYLKSFPSSFRLNRADVKDAFTKAFLSGLVILSFLSSFSVATAFQLKKNYSFKKTETIENKSATLPAGHNWFFIKPSDSRQQNNLQFFNFVVIENEEEDELALAKNSLPKNCFFILTHLTGQLNPTQFVGSKISSQNKHFCQNSNIRFIEFGVFRI
jgi:hypothetical protein